MSADEECIATDGTQATSPVAASSTRLGSVVIPAHQEGARIGACLEALSCGWRPGELDIVVVSNGSTDDTVSVARRKALELGLQVRVLDLSDPGKVGAIRAGEAVTDSPRLYLDADTRCTADVVRALLRAVTPNSSSSSFGVAVPRREFDLSRCSGPARLYYRAWAELPWIREQLAGRGGYALSREVRESFDEFPDVVADDRFATRLVPPDEAIILELPNVLAPAETLREILAVRRRVYAGNKSLEKVYAVPAHDRTVRGRLVGLAHLLLRPWLWPGLVLWAFVTGVAKRGATAESVPWKLASDSDGA